MLPLTLAAAQHWAKAGCKGLEIAPSMSAHEFQVSSASKFSVDMGLPTKVRSFLVDTVAVVVHTDGRRPSNVTFRVIRAACGVLKEVYGECPHESIVIYLRDNMEQKSLPVDRPVRVKDINSGFSWDNSLTVFRNSELHRTLVHELVHVWRTHSKDSKKHQALAARTMRAPPGCLLTEAFVEAVTWLIHGGFCTTGLNAKHALAQASGYLNVKDDGSTNGWAYFVGKAYLVADGGRMFHDTFFPQAGAVRLMDRAAFDSLLAIMQHFHGVTKLQPSKSRFKPVLCACDVGEPYVA